MGESYILCYKNFKLLSLIFFRLCLRIFSRFVPKLFLENNDQSFPFQTEFINKE